MTASREFCAHVTDLLSGFGPVAIRRMFGGAGVYREGVMFALVAYDTLYLKVDDTTRADYESAGMGPFTYQGKSEPVSLGYFQAPPETMEDADMLCDWARKAYGAALRARAAKKKPARDRKTKGRKLDSSS
ncbi:MAG: TfoX/Sxy family protein [Alphaproteobacteria bacterium]|nr:TfoX/Sxy family protein [Alphaproteobacteria bacterium]